MLEFTVSEESFVAVIVAVLALVGVVFTAVWSNRRTDRKFAEQGSKLGEQGAKLGEVHHQVRNNGGSSMKDAVDRIERFQQVNHEKVWGRLDTLDARLVQVDRNRDDIARLRDWVTRHDGVTEEALEDLRRIRAFIKEDEE